jgi:pilus assembly protein CpaB
MVAFVAFLLAAGATVGVFLYVRGVKHNNAAAAANLVQVIVSKQDITAGTRLDDLIAKGRFTTLQVPKDALVPGAVTDLSELQGQTTSTFILKGEQITTARLQGSTQPTGGVLGIPKGYEALSVSLEPQRSLNGVLQAGDHVVVLATIAGGNGSNGGAPTQAETVVVVPDVKVLSTTAGTTGTTGIITLALTPIDVSRVVLAQEQESVWLSLLPPNQTGTQEPPVLVGQLGKIGK